MMRIECDRNDALVGHVCNVTDPFHANQLARAQWRVPPGRERFVTAQAPQGLARPA